MKKSVSLFILLSVVAAFGGGFALCKAQRQEGAIRSPLWSPDGKRVAFLYALEGNTDVVVANLEAEGGGAVGDAVTISAISSGRRANSVERDIAWSPDGSALLFSSQRGGNFDICAFDVKSEEVECLTDGPEEDFFPVWRPDGKRIAYCSYREGTHRVYTMDADGSKQEGFYKPGACYPTWSPDGEKMAVTYHGDIVVVDIESGREKNITAPLISGDWVDDTFPLWSPTKDRIILLGRFEAYLTEIYALSSGGKKLARLSDNVYEDIFPAWSPDGRWVAYAAYVPKRRSTTELFMSREDNSERRRLTKNWVFDISPSFSPDGGRVLFIRREGLKDALYVMGVGDIEADGDKTDEKPLFPDGFRITKKLAAAEKKK